MSKEKVPWNQAVLYQVYPWTFKEDEERAPQLGNGSIRGIIEKLPYLMDLGVNAIWVSPPYPGPMHDAGYDTTDITDIHPDLGAIQDFDDLLNECHENGLRVMLDFIPNHTSEEHEWFVKSRNREPGFENHYIWHPGKKDEKGHFVRDENGRPLVPNNWLSVFSKPNKQARLRGEMPELRDDERTPGVSAWKWDDLRDEYYLHMFETEQPDLNWHNDTVVKAMQDSMHFWLEKGVDGFRMDAVNHMAKDFTYRDDRIDTSYNEHDNDNPADQLLWEHRSNYMPEYRRDFDFFREVARDTRYEDRDIFLLIESYVGESVLHEINNWDPEVATTFNFGGMRMDWDAIKVKIQMDYYYENVPSEGVPNTVNGNHDNSRLASRLGDAAARAAAVKNLMSKGMCIIYNGEELGLHDAYVPPERIQDPNGLRDMARTPIIWDDEKPNGGFSHADPDKTWLPWNEADKHLSVTKQQNDPHSSFALYKAAIKLRSEVNAIRDGDYVSLHTDNDQVLAFGRKAGHDQSIILINFSPYIQHVNISGQPFSLGKSVLSSVDVTRNMQPVYLEHGVHLQPDEARVIVPVHVSDDEGEHLKHVSPDH
jgi:alpha-glucosidase